jgi:murein DD-endopeptidase MepM/ murein hydrolase activator NlpD
MLSNQCVRTAFVHRRAAQGLLVAIAAAAGACSADVTRFDPAFNLTSSSDRAATGSLAVPPEPMARSYPRFDEPPAAPRGAGLSSEPRSGYGAAAPSAGPGEGTAGARDYADPPPRAAMAPTSDRFTSRHIDRLQPSHYQAGDSIEVQPGDSIFAIAKRYGVSIAALIELNGLTHGSSLQPGQRIILPVGARRVREDTAARAPAPAAAAPTVVAAAPPQRLPAPSAPASGWEGQHTMKAGESLYGIARQYRVALADLQRANGITEPTRVRIGTVLRVPGAQPAVERTALQTTPAAAAPRVVQSSMAAAPGKARIINTPVEQDQQAAAQRRLGADRPANANAAATETGSGRFRWPVRGRIIANFGKRPDGTHNDGINLAVPQGTDIHAVEGGRVAYAGSELKGYGNLVLIRHDNGWVSAYAHADQVLVRRDDVVRRGQVIAKAGKTGTVDQPQLHFELRQGSKPVDPVPHLEN